MPHKPKPALAVNFGLVTVHHAGADSPLQLDEDEAARRLLAFDDLLAACEAVNDPSNWDENGCLSPGAFPMIADAIKKAKGE